MVITDRADRLYDKYAGLESSRKVCSWSPESPGMVVDERTDKHT